MTETSPTLTRAEAARLNGAKSRGPRTPEGKARSARNALKHGLTAQAFALLPGEDAEAYAALLADLTRRYRPADALAAHLVQRLASVMWRQQRADRLEAEVLTQLEQRHDSSYIGGYVPSSPVTWDAARFSAVQRQQARLDRTLHRLMEELERLTPAEEMGEDDPANDNAPAPEEPDAAAPAAVVVSPAAQLLRTVPPAERPLSGDLFPLTPALEALLDEPGEDAWLRFVEGRTLQVDAALQAIGLPGIAAWSPSRRG